MASKIHPEDLEYGSKVVSVKSKVGFTTCFIVYTVKRVAEWNIMVEKSYILQRERGQKSAENKQKTNILLLYSMSIYTQYTPYKRSELTTITILVMSIR